MATIIGGHNEIFKYLLEANYVVKGKGLAYIKEQLLVSKDANGNTALHLIY
jgi:hypothetical protein